MDLREPTDPRRSTELRIPVVQEELSIAKEAVETGRVRIRTIVSERQEHVELPLSREEVIVERVAVDRPVDAPVAVRQEGDVTIVPVYEEILVVRKQLVLKEELHIRRRVHEQLHAEDVTLRRQDVDVQRLAPRDAPNA